MFQTCCRLTPILAATSTAVIRPVRIRTRSSTSRGTEDALRDLDVKVVFREGLSEDELREREAEVFGEPSIGSEEDVEVMGKPSKG